MKSMFAIPVIVLAVIACGCMAADPAAAPPGAGDRAMPLAVPDMVGTWTGPMQGYDEGTGFTDYPGLDVRMNVTEQHGRIFAGDFVFSVNGTETKSGFAGAIGHDGKTITITEQTGGYCVGEIVGGNEIELVYMQDGSPYSIAIDTWKRV
jgi:hypothetical protein